MSDLKIDPRSTALVLIDLQRGIVARPLAPYSGPDVVGKSVRLADRFRAAKSPVVLVHVAFSKDGRDALQQPVDETWKRPEGGMPADWAEFAPEIAPRDGDLVITKRNWGAFHGTDLDLQLRRRGVKTIVLGGIATNFGVESTARDAYERNYELIFPEDAATSMMADAHTFAFKTIFPRLGRVRSTEQVLSAFAAD